MALSDSESRLPAPFWFSAVLAVPALALYLWSLLLIRPFHPQYPGFVYFGLFMPPRPVHFAHTVFPLVFTLLSALVVVVAVRAMRNRRPIKAMGYAILIAHWVALIVFTVLFLWAAWWAANAARTARRLSRPKSVVQHRGSGTPASPPAEHAASRRLMAGT